MRPKTTPTPKSSSAGPSVLTTATVMITIHATPMARGPSPRIAAADCLRPPFFPPLVFPPPIAPPFTKWPEVSHTLLWPHQAWSLW